MRSRGRGRPPRVAIIRMSDLYEMPLRRESEALAEAGFDVEVICMRNSSERPNDMELNGVRITGLHASLSRSGRFRYAFEYAWFFTLAACVIAARHARRRY